MLLVSLTCFSMILATYGSPMLTNSHIIGGADAMPKQFPFVVQILYNGAHRCAGYIHNANWIVTSAACVYNLNPSQLKVIAGQLSLTVTDPGEETFSVSISHWHESYNTATYRNNIAMLQVSRPITLGAYSNVILHGQLPTPTTSGLLLGWGSNVQSGSIASTLKYTTVPIYTNQGTCPSVGTEIWNSNLMICAGDASHGPCTGDSGAPLVLEMSPSNYLAVGITSYISSCSNPAAFVRLSSYTNWIQSIAGGPVEVTTAGSSGTTSTNGVSVPQTTNDVSVPQTTNEVPESTIPQSTTPTSSLQTCNLASAGQFPFVVSVTDGVTGHQLCSGFIYNANHVVTTSSCANATSSAVIIAGVVRLTSIGSGLGVVRYVKRIVHNPEGDIAIIEITESFNLTDDNIKLIRYDSANNEAASTVVGWASTNAGGCVPSLDLLWGSNYISTSLDDCNSLNFNTSTMICAGPFDRSRAVSGSCRFENGVPLIQGIPAVVVGIKSGTEESCASKNFSTYIRISYFAGWLYINAGSQ